MKKFPTPFSRQHRPHQQGMTLVEMLVAMTLSAILVIIIFQIIVQAQIMAEVMSQRIRFNEEARLLFEMAANGGFSDMNGDNAINAAFADERLPGVRSGKDFALNQLNNYDAYQWDGTNNITANLGARSVLNRFNLYGERGTITALSNPRLQSSAVSTLDCTGAGSPSLDCIGVNSSTMGLLYNGRLRIATSSTLYPIFEKPYGSNLRLLHTRFELVDPDTIRNHYNPDLTKEVTQTFFKLPWAEREYYRSIFFLMRDY